VSIEKSRLREQFESERRRAAFVAFLPAAMTGIIVADTWISHWLGILGGVVAGLAAYGLVYAYESLMWQRHNGR
jgi:hypothetical protein